jgi:hypothetical protein
VFFRPEAGDEVVVGIDARDHEAWNGFTGHAGLLREVGANVSWCAALRCRASWSWHHLSVEEDKNAADAAATDGKPVTLAGSQLSWTGDLAPGAAVTITYSVTATGPEGASHAWSLPTDAATYRQLIHAKASETIRLPYVGLAPQPNRSELALFELRGEAFRADRFDAIRLKDGMIELVGLAPGDYDLWLKRQGIRIRIRVVDGSVQDGYVLGKTRLLELPGLAPLQIASITPDADGLTIKLTDASKFARVHVFAVRYRPAYSAFADLGRVRDRELAGIFPGGDVLLRDSRLLLQLLGRLEPSGARRTESDRSHGRIPRAVSSLPSEGGTGRDPVLAQQTDAHGGASPASRPWDQRGVLLVDWNEPTEPTASRRSRCAEVCPSLESSSFRARSPRGRVRSRWLLRPIADRSCPTGQLPTVLQRVRDVPDSDQAMSVWVSEPWQPNNAVEQTAGSPSLAAAAHRGRSAAHREAKEAW